PPTRGPGRAGPRRRPGTRGPENSPLRERASALPQTGAPNASSCRHPDVAQDGLRCRPPGRDAIRNADAPVRSTGEMQTRDAPHQHHDPVHAVEMADDVLRESTWPAEDARHDRLLVDATDLRQLAPCCGDEHVIGLVDPGFIPGA